MNIMSNLESFVVLGQGGIYAFVNDDKKLVQVFGSRNMLQGLSNIVNKLSSKEYGDMKDHMKELDLVILEYTEDIKPIWSKWIEYYRNKNYKFFKESYLIHYKVKCEVGNIKGSMYSLVYLENKRKDKIIVGIFDTIDEANMFKDKHYPDGKIDKLLYADNKYSKLLR